MKSKTIYILLAVIAVAVIVYVIYRKRNGTQIPDRISTAPQNNPTSIESQGTGQNYNKCCSGTWNGDNCDGGVITWSPCLGNAIPYPSNGNVFSNPANMTIPVNPSNPANGGGVPTLGQIQSGIPKPVGKL